MQEAQSIIGEHTVDKDGVVPQPTRSLHAEDGLSTVPKKSSTTPKRKRKTLVIEAVFTDDSCDQIANIYGYFTGNNIIKSEDLCK